MTFKGKLILYNVASFYSWPKRLLGLEGFPIKHKNLSEVKREFGYKKWVALLKIFFGISNFTLADVEAEIKNIRQLRSL